MARVIVAEPADTDAADILTRLARARRPHPAFPNVNPSFTVNGLVRRGAARDQQVLMSV